MPHNPVRFAVKTLRQARPVPRLLQERDRRPPRGLLQVEELADRNHLQIRPAQNQVQVAARVIVAADPAAIGSYFNTWRLLAQNPLEHTAMSRLQTQPLGHPSPFNACLLSNLLQTGLFSDFHFTQNGMSSSTINCLEE